MPSRRALDGEATVELRVIPAAEGAGPGLLERLKAAQDEMLEAALSADGLARVAELAAEAAGGAVAIVVPRLTTTVAPHSSLESTDVAALAAWVSARRRGPAAVPANVMAEVSIRFRGEVVGIVALLRSERVAHPNAVEYLHVASVAAHVAVAVDEAKAETEQRLRGSFLEDLRSRRELDGPDIVRRAARLGCDLTAGGMILCATLATDRPLLVTAMIAAECPGAIAEQIRPASDDRGTEPHVYAVLPAAAANGGAAGTVAAARRLVARLERHAVVALSAFRTDPADLGDAVQEAELVLDVLLQGAGSIANEIGNGTYRLLFRMLASHPDEVRAFYEATVAPVAEYDDRYGTELLPTLRAYLVADCNMNATAAAIFAHRHTVAYRLERVRELTDLDPTRSEDRERIGLGLKIHRIVAPPK